MDISHEGVLQKWTNYLLGWKSMYFVLHDGLLEYCKQKGNQPKGKISLSTLEVRKHPKNDCVLIVDTGTAKFQLKGQNLKDTQKWYESLKKATSIKKSEAYSTAAAKHKSTISGETKISYVLSSKISELWSIYSLINENFERIPKKLREAHPELEKTITFCKAFKILSSETLSIIESFDTNLSSINSKLSIPESEDYSLFSPKPDHLDSQEAQLDFPPIDESVEFEDARSHCSSEDPQSAPYRKCLPYMRNPNQKYNIWGVVKNSVGKELSKIAVPVYFNEPISFLQRFTEDLTYHEVILKACDSEDSSLRLAYIACFAVSSYVSTSKRVMKPFNPLLGETFELVKDGYRVISEQVSHHPPISCLHCEHSKFLYFASAQISTVFKGTYFSIQSLGKSHVVLKDRNDHFVWTKPQTNVPNMIFGKMNVDHHGKIEVSNVSTGEKAVLEFRKKGWFDKGQNEVSGEVFSSDGELKYKLAGQWDSHMTILSTQGEQKITAWEKYPFTQNYSQNYYFSEYALQLNLPPECYPGLLKTDSRYRPDQRALENGDIKLAESEKLRLEEKQREARKAREENQQEYAPRWFYEANGDWAYKGGYWEAKQSGCSDDILDIF